MSKKTFTVTNCTPNKTNGFVWTLTVDETATVFGITKNVKRTYYIGGMPADAKVGDQFQEDLSRFDVVERPFAYTENGTTTTMMLKWLHVRI
jgi:hypothetical protein